MKFAVLRFPVSNRDDAAVHVAQRVLAPLGASGQIVWHEETSLGDIDAVIVPGGFSDGDSLRTGAMAAHSPIMAAVRQFADNGGPVLGICSGFRILCESGLLDGTLARNESSEFVCSEVHCVVEGRPTPFSHAIPAGRHIKMSIAHAEGRYSHPDVDALEAEGRVVFRYCSADGEVEESANPNGSTNSIAGVCNAAANVVGLMPHPERACEDLLGEGGHDGRSLFECALAWGKDKPARV
jgi:phosphoribosylformylglycinamidine synthase